MPAPVAAAAVAPIPEPITALAWLVIVTLAQWLWSAAGGGDHAYQRSGFRAAFQQARAERAARLAREGRPAGRTSPRPAGAAIRRGNGWDPLTARRTTDKTADHRDPGSRNGDSTMDTHRPQVIPGSGGANRAAGHRPPHQPGRRAGRQQGAGAANGRAICAGWETEWETSREERHDPEDFAAWLRSMAAGMRWIKETSEESAEEYHRGDRRAAEVPERILRPFLDRFGEGLDDCAEAFDRFADDYERYAEDAAEEMAAEYGAEVVDAAAREHPSPTPRGAQPQAGQARPAQPAAAGGAR